MKDGGAVLKGAVFPKTAVSQDFSRLSKLPGNVFRSMSVRTERDDTPAQFVNTASGFPVGIVLTAGGGKAAGVDLQSLFHPDQFFQDLIDALPAGSKSAGGNRRICRILLHNPNDRKHQNP